MGRLTCQEPRGYSHLTKPAKARLKAASTRSERSHVSENPPYLFDCWSQVAERVRLADRLALFLDFDGTLAPFRTRPDEVNLSDSTRRVLKRLGRHSRVGVFILSGRRRVDVENRVGVPGLCYLGLHGWEGPKRLGKKRCGALRKGGASAPPQSAPQHFQQLVVRASARA